MADPRQQVVLAVFDAFRGAIRDGDAARAQDLSTEAGWIGRGDAAGRFFRRAMRNAHVPGEAGEVVVRDARAAVRFVDGLGEERYALFERDDDGAWRLAAVPPYAVRSGLFLRGEVDATTTARDLPDSEEAAAWGRRFTSAGPSWTPETWPDDAEAAAAVEKLKRLAARPGGRVDRLAALEVPGDRAAVGLVFTQRGSNARDEVWVVLGRDATTGRLAVRHLAWVKELDAFLEDLPVGWDGDAPAPADDTPLDDDAADGFSAARLDHILSLAVGELERAGGGAASRELAADVQRRFRERLRRGGGPRVEPTREASDDAPVSIDLGAAVRKVVEGAATDGEVVVDREFVAKHGRGLLDSVIGAFAKALVPAGPVAAEVGEGDTRARVEVDVVDLVGSLLPDRGAATDDTPGDES